MALIPDRHTRHTHGHVWLWQLFNISTAIYNAICCFRSTYAVMRLAAGMPGCCCPPAAQRWQHDLLDYSGCTLCIAITYTVTSSLKKNKLFFLWINCQLTRISNVINSYSTTIRLVNFKWCVWFLCIRSGSHSYPLIKLASCRAFAIAMKDNWK